MHITIAGPGELMLVIVVILAVLLVGMMVGFIWAGRRRYVARREEFAAEVGRQTLALDDREFLLDRRKVELDEREDVLDERDRDLAGQEAEMDQKQAALRERERLRGISFA